MAKDRAAFDAFHQRCRLGGINGNDGIEHVDSKRNSAVHVSKRRRIALR